MVTYENCKRCRTKEEIPTWQFFKFYGDKDPRYLCGRCFSNGLGFMSEPFTEETPLFEKRRRAHISRQNHCYTCSLDKPIPEHHSVEIGNESGKKRYFCGEHWDFIISWFNRWELNRLLNRGH